MKLTNKHNLPGPIVSAIAATMRDSPPNFSVTTLIRPAHLVALEIKHWDELETDTMDAVWRLDGTVFHNAVNINDSATVWREHMFTTTIRGITVRGVIDRLWNDVGGALVLTEWKKTSQWSVIYGKDEWVHQLNLQAALLRRNDFRPDRLEVVAWMRDFSARDASFDSQKPQHPIATIAIDKWDSDRAERFLDHRVSAHQAARAAPASSECTSAERWEKPTMWAVMKPGRKTALRVLKTNAEADQWGSSNVGGTYTIVRRPGENTRCERGYCPVAAFCEQFKRIRESKEQAA